MDLPYALFSLFLERFGIGSKIRILIPKELIRDLPCEYHPHVRAFMYRFTDKVHPYGCPDRSDIIGSQKLYYLLCRLLHILF